MKNTRVSGMFCAGVFLSALLILALGQPYAEGEGETVLKGAVSDVEGGAVQGARVFVYDSPDVKRAADFISAPTGEDGLYRIVLPPGRYWAVARLKKTGDYGPLGPGDKHSGEALEIELSTSEEEINFTVANLREAIKSGAQKTEDLLKIKGRIIDGNGSPLKGAYATAHRTDEISGFPDYISAWVDDKGGFALYVPRGIYFIGSALTFPPGESYVVSGKMTFDENRSDLEIVRKSRDKK